MKLLFDIYHVQIMHGDVIRRIEQNKDVIGHVHTAGNPGRGELDDKQEINYPPIMRKLLEIDYTGYVGQEFIPTRDPLEGLREAVRAVRRVTGMTAGAKGYGWDGGVASHLPTEPRKDTVPCAAVHAPSSPSSWQLPRSPPPNRQRPNRRIPRSSG